MFPDEFGAFFLAQVAALALVQIWRAGRQASRQELGNHPDLPTTVSISFSLDLPLFSGLCC